jgi:GNAT superfamily N-acetyltransferase
MLYSSPEAFLGHVLDTVRPYLDRLVLIWRVCGAPLRGPSAGHADGDPDLADLRCGPRDAAPPPDSHVCVFDDLVALPRFRGRGQGALRG